MSTATAAEVGARINVAKALHILRQEVIRFLTTAPKDAQTKSQMSNFTDRVIALATMIERVQNKIDQGDFGTAHAELHTVLRELVLIQKDGHVLFANKGIGHWLADNLLIVVKPRLARIERLLRDAQKSF